MKIFQWYYIKKNNIFPISQWSKEYLSIPILFIDTSIVSYYCYFILLVYVTTDFLFSVDLNMHSYAYQYNRLLTEQKNYISGFFNSDVVIDNIYPWTWVMGIVIIIIITKKTKLHYFTLWVVVVHRWLHFLCSLST